MKKSRAVVKSDNTDKMMNFLSGTVSEQLTDTQQDGQIEITTELLYKLVCRNCFGLNLPDVKFFQSSLKSEVLSFREFRLYYVGDSMFSCEFTIGIDPTFTCHITGFYVAVNDGNVISKQFNENFEYSLLLELTEEQSDNAQLEERSENGQSKDIPLFYTGLYSDFYNWISSLSSYQDIDDYSEFTEALLKSAEYSKKYSKEQSDSGQSEEQSDSGQSEEQSDSEQSEEQSDSGQSEEQSDSGQSEEQSTDTQMGGSG